MDYHLKKQNPHAGKIAINSLKTHYLKLSADMQAKQSQFADVSQLSKTLINSSTIKTKKAAKEKLEVKIDTEVKPDVLKEQVSFINSSRSLPPLSSRNQQPLTALESLKSKNGNSYIDYKQTI